MIGHPPHRARSAINAPVVAGACPFLDTALKEQHNGNISSIMILMRNMWRRPKCAALTTSDVILPVMVISAAHDRESLTVRSVRRRSATSKIGQEIGQEIGRKHGNKIKMRILAVI